MKHQTARASLGFNTPGILSLLFGVFCCSLLSAQSFKHEVQNKADFDDLKGRPANQKYGQVASLKVVWEIESDELFFINSKQFQWHYDFVIEELDYPRSRYVFNQLNYAGHNSREFVLANLNFYESSQILAVEFSAADYISQPFIEGFMKRLLESVRLDVQARLFLNTQRLETMFANLKPEFGLVNPGEIYQGQTYQPLRNGSCFGYLRKMSLEDLKKMHPGMHDILVINGSPLEIPATAGLITSEFQTPLSHLNVLCQNRGTPSMAQKGIWENPMVDSLEWDLVYLEVSPDTFILKKSSLALARQFWEQNRPCKVKPLKRNLDKRDLLPVSKLNHRRMDVVGGKAANFGILARLAKASKSKFKVPEGAFAIPFYWYDRHLRQSGAQLMLDTLLASTAMQKDPVVLSQKLKAIRSQIKSHPISPELIALVYTQVRDNGGFERMRFRSSTNAEDTEGFNGAGLYTSKTGYVNDTTRKKTAEVAIKKVWASAWNYRAFQERTYFGLDQKMVAMGVLVHRSFPNETVNGVAITKNLYRKSYFGFVINLQAGDVSVVSPPAGVICDQLICYSDSDLAFFSSKAIVEYINHSNLNNGNAILEREKVVELTAELARIKKYFYWNTGGNSRKYDYKDFALDIEFKIDGPQNQIYIKQARIFNN